MVISYSLRRIDVFLKIPMIIIIRYGENNVLGTIYIDFRCRQGWVHGLPDIVLFIQNLYILIYMVLNTFPPNLMIIITGTYLEKHLKSLQTI